MNITPLIFEAFLKCPTKCWLRFASEPTAGNAYAEWVQAENESYRGAAAKRLLANLPESECAISPAAANLKTAQWRFAVDVPARSEFGSSRGNEAQTEKSGIANPKSEISQSLFTSAATIEACLHAVERIPSAGRGQPAQFVPIRFLHRNKLTKDDKLLLAFDAFVLSEMVGRAVSLGKIIHGDDHATLKVKLGARTAESLRTGGKTTGLLGEVRKRIADIATLLSRGNSVQGAESRSADSHVRESQSSEETRGLSGPRSVPAPDLVLNRHCAECEFQARCRKLAVEKDDLSLLAGMSAKERQKLRSKGIFTVTQLSYTFRPRRRPRRQRDKREKYHHSLKSASLTLNQVFPARYTPTI